LFINQTANKQNTRVEVSPESIVRITAPHFHKNWKEEKLSYNMTSRYFKGMSRYLMGFETCSRLFFLLAIIACLVYGILSQDWIMVGIASFLWLLRFIILLVVFRKTSLALNERKFYSTLFLFDWMQPLWNLRFKLQQRTIRKTEFMRK
jgi:uncharacterized ion transporter superfamily protein YfcC